MIFWMIMELREDAIYILTVLLAELTGEGFF
jgi:hypothetical protein